MKLLSILSFVSVCVLVSVQGLEINSGSTTTGTQQTLKGPESFFTENFYLTLKKSIILTIFDSNGTRLDNINIDSNAVSIKGGYGSDKKLFSVNLDWKSKTFKGKSLTVDGLLLRLSFKTSKTEYMLSSIEVDQISIDNSNVEQISINAVSKGGYEVAAPIGSAFSCSDVGMFPPKKGQKGKYLAGITFPGMKVQVGNLNEPKFGPSWGCGELLTIGVWIGLIVTLFFALILWWGFSMLANIHTPDRFDDPKGKPLHLGLIDG